MSTDIRPYTFFWSIPEISQKTPWIYDTTFTPFIVISPTKGFADPLLQYNPRDTPAVQQNVNNCESQYFTTCKMKTTDEGELKGVSK